MVDQFLIGNMRNFVYLITSDGESMVVDPQPDLKPWQAQIQKLNSKLVGVLLTHTHHDHVGGVPYIAKEYGVPVYVHNGDVHRLERAPEAVRKFYTPIEDGQKITLGSKHVEVWHTPGHSVGECSYLLKWEKPWRLFTGDTVFVGDVGRTDLETGSTAELFSTLQRMKTLPGDTIIYPGHDYGRTPTTTIDREIKESKAFQCRTVEDLEVLP